MAHFELGGVIQPGRYYRQILMGIMVGGVRSLVKGTSMSWHDHRGAVVVMDVQCC